MATIGSLRVAPYNDQEVLICLAVDAEGNQINETHHSWVTQLTLSGSATLTINTTGSYTVTAKDYLGNLLSTFTDIITIQTTDVNGDRQAISVPIANGTGMFQFSAATAGTYKLVATGQTKGGIPYDCNDLEVEVS